MFNPRSSAEICGSSSFCKRFFLTKFLVSAKPVRASLVAAVLRCSVVNQGIEAKLYHRDTENAQRRKVKIK
jgi:hypothetical protein